MSAHLSTHRRSSPKPSHRSKSATIYDQVTARIVSALEAGVVPWRKPWPDAAFPCNAVSKRSYHGVNFLLLGLARYQDHRWLTFLQAKELGGHVKTGEKATLVVFWKQWKIEKPDPGSGEMRSEKIPLLRYFPVFNAAQCEGLALPDLQVSSRPGNERIARAEEVIGQMSEPPRLHEGCKQACYYPLVDVVQMPGIQTFDSADSYYATLFHEYGHATGHESRLNRPGLVGQPKFGSQDYSREELVAELTSSFCCAHLGLDNSLLDNAASYIDGWLHALRSDPKAIVTAAAQAQKAADYLLGITQKEDEEAEGNEVEAEREEIPA